MPAVVAPSMRGTSGHSAQSGLHGGRIGIHRVKSRGPLPPEVAVTVEATTSTPTWLLVHSVTVAQSSGVSGRAMLLGVAVK